MGPSKMSTNECWRQKKSNFETTNIMFDILSQILIPLY
jgi:hypothetical protein